MKVCQKSVQYEAIEPGPRKARPPFILVQLESLSLSFELVCLLVQFMHERVIITSLEHDVKTLRERGGMKYRTTSHIEQDIRSADKWGQKIRTDWAIASPFIYVTLSFISMVFAFLTACLHLCSVSLSVFLSPSLSLFLPSSFFFFLVF